MPTRPQTWRFQAIYNGFEHGGLRAEFDRETSTPIDRAGRVVRVGGHIVDTRRQARRALHAHARHRQGRPARAPRGDPPRRGGPRHAASPARCTPMPKRSTSAWRSATSRCMPSTSGRCCGRAWASTSTCGASRARPRPSAAPMPSCGCCRRGRARSRVELRPGGDARGVGEVGGPGASGRRRRSCASGCRRRRRSRAATWRACCWIRAPWPSSTPRGRSWGGS